MKKLLIAGLMLCSILAQAQYKFDVVVNTPNTPTISIVITDLGNGSPINTGSTAVAYAADLLTLVSMESDGQKVFNSTSIVTATSFTANGLRIVIRGLSKADILKVMSMQENIYLALSKDISLTLTSGSFGITAADFANNTKGKIEITDDVMNMYLGAFGGEYAYANNSFNWSYTPKAQSDLNKFEVNAEFVFHQAYSLSKGGAKNSVFYTKGRVSTNEKDSLNYLYIYPINLDISGSGKARVFAQFGVESNQVFSSGRIAANLSYQKIIDNLVNLSYGNNRLRLKPVMNFGAKVYKEFDNMRIGAAADNEFSVQAYANMYYNIPVFDIYTIIFEANAYYDFSDKVNPNQDIGFNYSIALGVDVPNSPFKTLFKYRDGQVDVNNLSDSNLTIGLLADVESLLSKGK